MGQISVITSQERRRRWSDEQKAALVDAAFAPGANVAAAARAADICSSLLYRWRREFSDGTSGAFSRAVLIDDRPAQAAAAKGGRSTWGMRVKNSSHKEAGYDGFVGGAFLGSGCQ